MAYFYKFTAKRPLTFLLVIIVTCQLILFSSFLFSLTAVLAQVEENSSAESPAETTIPESAAPIIAESPPPTETPTETNSETPTETTLETIIEATPKTATEQNPTPAENIIAPTETASNTEPVDITGVATNNETSTTTLESSTANQESGTAQTIILGTGDSSDNSGGVSQTGLTMDTSGGFQPIVLAQWTMDIASSTDGQYVGNDDASSTGAQFLPSGQLAVNKTIMVCAVAADQDGAADIDGVYASTYYPENIALASSRQIDGGCGKIYGEEFVLKPLSEEQGAELFCNKIKNNNNSLPAFNTDESFDSFCAPNGKLALLAARLYCAEKVLAYDDPAGDYKIEIYAQDKIGNLSPTFTNIFKYLELTAFAVDFNNISYGSVQLNTPKIIKGNLDWETPVAANPATIRNVGNTRMKLLVEQNDFGLGKTNGAWNIGYQTRVGVISAFVSYLPEQTTVVGQIIDLAETNALDFGIEVYNFPSESTSTYAGHMILTADKVDYLGCY